MNAAEATARRVLAGGATSDPQPLLAKMFALVLGSPPTPEEQADLLGFVARMKERYTAKGDKDAELRAWAMACHALFASSRFEIVE